MKRAALLMLACLSACASDRPAPPAPPRAPQLMRGAEGSLFWANPQLFYPVPLQQRARAADACASLGLTPAGFHPGALDPNGKPLRGGGFFCVE